MKIGSNRDINKDRKKLLVTLPDDTTELVISGVQHDSVGATIPYNLKMLTEKHHNGKIAITILIVGAGLIAYDFWLKINGIIIHNP